MKSLVSYLLLCFMVMFWIFRLVVAFTNTMGIDFGFVPIDLNFEVVLLFITLLSIVLVAKNKIMGAIIYIISYGAYFGVDLYSGLMKIIEGETVMAVEATNILASFIGIVIPVAVLFNLLIERNKMVNPVDKQTDWFYKNKEFDRELDERADQNQYRNY